MHSVLMHCRFVIALTLGVASGLPAPTHVRAAEKSQVNLAPTALAQGIEARISRVPEFQFIQQQAERLGVRAWLFGGTAAGFGHYVHWDLKREAGDTRYQKERFDYDYTNIYRATQDLDIVVDGPAEKAEELRRLIAEEYPHLQGSKSAWEVRLLRANMGDKQALLNNSDFLNQHTDSNSTGMIELTKPAPGESVIRDLRDWNSKDPYFLKDMREGKLHYYFSPLHQQTTFYKEGRNPPILSVVRYLTKAFQYELELRPEDLARVKKIVDEFNPKGDETQNAYVRGWLLKKENGRKLVQNAVNMEYAMKVLDELGLRKKLIAIEDNIHAADSLAWWMNRKPLKSFPVGQGRGKTAADHGIRTVSHSTPGFSAYESITKAHTGDPNVFTSREDASREAAMHGEGFYTKVGQEGADARGFTVRLELNPRAREGADFIYLPKEQYVILLNRNAARVIPESLNWSYPEYFRWFASGETPRESDHGIFSRLERRLKQQPISPGDRKEMNAITFQAVRDGKPVWPLYDAWIKTKPSYAETTAFIRELFAHPEVWGQESLARRSHATILSRGMDAAQYPGMGSTLIETVRTNLSSKTPNPLLLSVLASREPDERIAFQAMHLLMSSDVDWKIKKDILSDWIDRKRQPEVLSSLIRNIESYSKPRDFEALGQFIQYEKLLERGGSIQLAAEDAVADISAKLMADGKTDGRIVGLFLTRSEEYLTKHLDILDLHFKTRSLAKDVDYADRELLKKQRYRNLPNAKTRLRNLASDGLAVLEKGGFSYELVNQSALWLKTSSQEDPTLAKSIAAVIDHQTRPVFSADAVLSSESQSLLELLARNHSDLLSAELKKEIFDFSKKEKPRRDLGAVRTELVKSITAGKNGAANGDRELVYGFVNRMLDQSISDPSSFESIMSVIDPKSEPELWEKFKSKALAELRTASRGGSPDALWTITHWFNIENSVYDQEIENEILRTGNIDLLMRRIDTSPKRRKISPETRKIILEVMKTQASGGHKWSDEFGRIAHENLEHFSADEAEKIFEWTLDSDLKANRYSERIYSSDRFFQSPNLGRYLAKIGKIELKYEGHYRTVISDGVRALKSRPDLIADPDAATAISFFIKRAAGMKKTADPFEQIQSFLLTNGWSKHPFYSSWTAVLNGNATVASLPGDVSRSAVECVLQALQKIKKAF